MTDIKQLTDELQGLLDGLEAGQVTENELLDDFFYAHAHTILAALKASNGANACEVCFTVSWEPIADEGECALVHPHEGEHRRCGYCWQHELVLEQVAALKAADELAALCGRIATLDVELKEHRAKCELCTEVNTHDECFDGVAISEEGYDLLKFEIPAALASYTAIREDG